MVIHRPSPDDRFSFCINASCVTLALPLMISLTLSRSDLTLFFAGLISSLPSYLCTFWPRKSKPSAMFVILVFSSESSRPRAAINRLTAGSTLHSSTSFDTPVTIKSSVRISDERDRPFRDGDRRFRQRDRSFRKRDRADRKAGLALRMTSTTRAMLAGFGRRDDARAPDEHAHDQGRFTT